MDEAVVQSMARWPQVPACYDWLELSRRGEWRLGPTAPREKVSHAGLAEFIGRNYEHDEIGRWFMQNGPQRVYVRLEYTPWVFHLANDGELLSHTRLPAGPPSAAWLDDEGNLLLQTSLGVGVLDDRDLPALLPALCDAQGRTLGDAELEDRLGGPEAITGVYLNWRGQLLKLSSVQRHSAAQLFSYDPSPLAALP